MTYRTKVSLVVMKWMFVHIAANMCSLLFHIIARVNLVLPDIATYLQGFRHSEYI